MSGLIFVLIWSVCGFVAVGFFNASIRADSKLITGELSARDARQYFGGSALIGAVGGPISLLVAFCSSGFGADGWTLSLDAVEKRNPGLRG